MDIKELRIGNSVLMNGVRAKVIDLHRDILNLKESPYRIFVEGISPETGELMQVGAFVASDSVQPIPLTEELLKDMGFEKKGSNAYTKYLYESECFERVIRCCFLDDWRSTWTIEYWDDDNRNYHIGAEYLHELETFVFMTTKKELI